MNRFLTPLFFLFIFAAGAFSVSAQNFEGKITLNIYNEDSGESGEADYYISGDKFALTTKNEEHSVDIVLKENSMFIVLHQMKMYMKVPFNEFGNDSDEPNSSDKSEDLKGKFIKTGNTKVINGYTCDEYKITSEEGKDVIAWMTKELGGFFLFHLDSQVNSPFGDIGRLSDLAGYFPIRLSTFEDGEEKVLLEVTDVHQGKVDPKIFEIPSDYKELQQGLFKDSDDDE